MIFIKRIYCVALIIAVTAFISACQTSPSSDDAVSADEQSLNDTESVVLTVNPYLSNRPSVPVAAEKMFANALAAIDQQQWADAKTQLITLTEAYPNLSGPLLNLALVHIELNDLEAAETAFQQAISVNANNVNAYNHYGVFLRTQGRFDEAETVFQQALERWPDYPEGHLNLGILYDLYQGEHQQALQHYEYYQTLQSEPGRQVQGWIVDLQRRIKAQQATGG
jgi:Tfp pilus assembly protein PilF